MEVLVLAPSNVLRYNLKNLVFLLNLEKKMLFSYPEVLMKVGLGWPKTEVHLWKPLFLHGSISLISPWFLFADSFEKVVNELEMQTVCKERTRERWPEGCPKDSSWQVGSRPAVPCCISSTTLSEVTSTSPDKECDIAPAFSNRTSQEIRAMLPEPPDLSVHVF